MQEIKRRSERVTGVSNVAHNALTVLTNQLQGAAALEEYKQDAQDEGDQEAVELFESLQQHEVARINELKRFVQQRLG